MELQTLRGKELDKKASQNCEILVFKNKTGFLMQRKERSNNLTKWKKSWSGLKMTMKKLKLIECRK